ncbi:hypothetical protein AALB16_12325 [Lachnospiraceae bacterium 62-35]
MTVDDMVSLRKHNLYHQPTGFDTVQVIDKIADGYLPGETYPEKTEEISTIICQDGAAAMLQTLYGEID